MKISIITVTYNRALTLSDTIQSVLNQTYNNIEYIIIDGLSNDNTLDIIKKYEPDFTGKLKWVSENDNGFYDALNKGIKMATGDIVGILNSDDFFTSSDVIKRVSQEFEKSSIDAIYGDVHYVNPNNLKKIVRYYSSKIFKPSLMRIGLMPAHPTFYVKRSCFEKIGLYNNNYMISADFDLLLRFIFIHKIMTKYIPMDMVTMRIGGVSTGGCKRRAQIMKEHLRCLRKNGVKSNVFLLSVRYLYKLTEFIIIKH